MLNHAVSYGTIQSQPEQTKTEPTTRQYTTHTPHSTHVCHTSRTDTKNKTKRTMEDPNNQLSVTTQYGLQALPTAIQSRTTSPITILTAKKHELIDGRTWAFDLVLIEQTDGTADPASVNGVLGDYMAAISVRHFNINEAGVTEDEWTNLFRAVFRPKAGKVFTVNVREVLKPLFPKCLPEYIFVKDPTKATSKFKLAWKGETTIAPFMSTAPDSRWMHLFVPATCLASKPELKIAITGKLEEVGLTIKPEEKDFNCIQPAIGKWHVNFTINNGMKKDIAENLYKLAKLEVEQIGINTYISPEFMNKLTENCPGCYTWLKFNPCFCPHKGQKKDGYKRAKDGEAAAQRKRRMEAATSSDAAF